MAGGVVAGAGHDAVEVCATPGFTYVNCMFAGPSTTEHVKPAFLSVRAGLGDRFAFTFLINTS